MKLRATLSALIILAILTPISATAAPRPSQIDRQDQVRQQRRDRIQTLTERLKERMAERQKLTRQRLSEQRLEARDRQAKRFDATRFQRKMHQMASRLRLELRQTFRKVIRKSGRSAW